MLVNRDEKIQIIAAEEIAMLKLNVNQTWSIWNWNSSIDSKASLIALLKRYNSLNLYINGIYFTLKQNINNKMQAEFDYLDPSNHDQETFKFALNKFSSYCAAQWGIKSLVWKQHLFPCLKAQMLIDIGFETVGYLPRVVLHENMPIDTIILYQEIQL